MEADPKSAVSVEGGNARWTSASVSRDALEPLRIADFSKGMASECERDVASA